MSLYVDVVADPKAFPPQSSAQPEQEGPTAFEQTTEAYAAYYADYVRALAGNLDLANLENPQSIRSGFPEVVVLFEQGDESLAFDGDLFRRLFEVYVAHGWEGIQRVESALLTQVREGNSGPPSGGTIATVWPHVGAFFKLTRNLIAALVRGALIDIERKAAFAIRSRLKSVEAALERAWTSEFQFREDRKTRTIVGPEKERRTVVEISYAIGNKGLANALFAALTTAVQAKAAYEAKLQDMRNRVEALRGRAATHERRKQNLGAPGYTSPYGEEATPENTQRAAGEQKAIEDAFVEFSRTVRSWIYVNCPLALLVLDGLKPGFTLPDMEHRIGTVLGDLRGKARGLAKTLQAAVNQVELHFPPPPATLVGDFGRLSSKGFEQRALELALSHADDPAFFPLLSEDTWHYLVDSGLVAKGSIAYVVYFHYVSSLMREEEARVDRQPKGGQLLLTIGAVLSLASFVLPPLAPIDAAVGIFLLFYGVGEVISQLSALDASVGKLLSQPDSFGLPSLARVGELAAMRKELVQSFAREVVQNIVMTAVGARWLLAKRLLLAHGYYSDLGTLYSGGDGEIAAQK